MSNEDSKVDAKTSTKVTVPDVKELLKAGVQFGHETKRWNPKMRKYIYGDKNSIHIIDVFKTEELLKKAVVFLEDAASKGQVLFIGTKRQASDIIREEAIRAGAFFIDERWAGGLLTNFQIVKKSLDKLNYIESQLEKGVEDRTKYEVSLMKKEWQRLNRLYSGIKGMVEKPTAVVIIDTNFEKAAVRECKKIGIPIIAIIDTNSDPDSAQYTIPANDDAIASIALLVRTLADAVLRGNKGKGINHKLQDYAKLEVKIIKIEKEVEESVSKLDIVESEDPKPQQPSRQLSAPTKSKGKAKGILERVKEEAEVKKSAKTTKKSKK
jgi:small subunit ribosomal protein S2